VSFTKVLTPFTILFHTPSPIPGIVSTNIIYPFVHTYVHNICSIFTVLHHFPTSLHTGTTPPPRPRQDLFCPPVLQFCIKKEEGKK
jgi:hypothetical protein